MPFTEEQEKELRELEETSKWRLAFADRVDEVYEKLRLVGLEAGAHKMSGLAGEMLTFTHRLGTIASEARGIARHNLGVIEINRKEMEKQDLAAAQQVNA